MASSRALDIAGVVSGNDIRNWQMLALSSADAAIGSKFRAAQGRPVSASCCWPHTVRRPSGVLIWVARMQSTPRCSRSAASAVCAAGTNS